MLEALQLLVVQPHWRGIRPADLAPSPFAAADRLSFLSRGFVVTLGPCAQAEKSRYESGVDEVCGEVLSWGCGHVYLHPAISLRYFRAMHRAKAS
jgi:hypothetical protein